MATTASAILRPYPRTMPTVFRLAWHTIRLNRLSTVVDNRLPSGANITTYVYDPANNVVTETAPNGLQTTFNYDQQNRLTSLTTPVSSYTISWPDGHPHRSNGRQWRAR